MRYRWISATFAAGALFLVSAQAAATPPTADECASADEAAQTLRRAGEIRAARHKLLICVNKGCPAMVSSDCAERLNEVEKTIPTVVFVARDATGHDLTAVTVTMDGARLVDHLDGTSLPVDPGTHRFVFTVPGVSPLMRDLAIREGEKDRREHVVLGVVWTDAGGATTGAGSPLTANDRSEPAAEGHVGWPMWAAFGVGVTGLAVGSISGILALSTKSTLDRECPSKNGCPQGDIDALSTTGWTSNIGFAVGIVGAAVGFVLLATSGGSDQPAVSAQIGLGTLTMVGRLP